MRRLISLSALLVLFGVVGCCHDTCDSCRTSHCPSCTLGHGGYVAPCPVTPAQPATTTGEAK